MHTILLLTISNIFMTIAWYGHLKYKDSPLWIVILASWGIAFVEYCFQVPAHRIDHYQSQRRPVENYSIGHYRGGALRVFGCLPEGRTEMELYCRFCHDGRGGLRHVQRMVREG